MQLRTEHKTQALREQARVASYGVLSEESIRRNEQQRHSKKSVRLIAVNLTLFLLYF